MNSAEPRSSPAPSTRTLMAGLFAALATFSANGQVVTSSGGATIIQQYSGPPASTWTPPAETFYSGPSLGPSGRPPQAWEVFVGPDESAYRRISRPAFGPFYLPTLLPVLGAIPATDPVPLARGYPREFAGEPFFMAYGNLAANRLLSEKRLARLAAYRAARLALLTELRGQLDRSKDASADARSQSLAELAATQTPLLLELEAEAEKIRHDLTHVEMFKTAADDIGNLVPTTKPLSYLGPVGNTVRFDLSNQVLDADDPKSAPTRATLRLFLSAAHSQAGFSSDQRRLLEEMAWEMQLVIEPEPATKGAAPVFFWPAGARIAAPTGLTPKAAARFDEFQRRKAALKDELRALLERENNRLFRTDTTEAHLRLADAQAPRFAELDALADEIRPALSAPIYRPALGAAPPHDLARQVANFAKHKEALQRELRSTLTGVRKRLSGERVELVSQKGIPAIAIMTSDGRPREGKLPFNLGSYNEELAVRFGDLYGERDTVHAALARYQASLAGARPEVTVDQLATDFLAAFRERDTRLRQRDYFAAVFVPGLSPAQRRLLLAAAAVEALAERSSGEP